MYVYIYIYIYKIIVRALDSGSALKFQLRNVIGPKLSK